VSKQTYVFNELNEVWKELPNLNSKASGDEETLEELFNERIEETVILGLNWLAEECLANSDEVEDIIEELREVPHAGSV
jgi:hypothetical protein